MLKWPGIKRGRKRPWYGPRILSRIQLMKRCEAWWLNFDYSIGGVARKKRPAVIVSNAAQENETFTLHVGSIIRYGENKQVWVPLDPSHTHDELNLALSKGKIGKLKAEILWFGDKPVFRRYRPKIKKV
jgi:mRNA-degrading endonuclease toxin of MazEF toxin-antitoxin module